MAELVLTRHARLAVDRRGLKRGDIRACVYHPDSTKAGNCARTEVRRKALDDGRVVVAVLHPTRRYLRLITAYLEGPSA